MALLQKETCNLRHPMHLRHFVSCPDMEAGMTGSVLQCVAVCCSVLQCVAHSHNDSLTRVLSVSLICVLRLIYFPVMSCCGNSHDAYTYTHWHTHTNTQGIHTRKHTHTHRSGARTPGNGDIYEKSCPGYGDTYVKSCLWRYVRVLLRHVRVLLRHVRVLLTCITHVTIWVS